MILVPFHVEGFGLKMRCIAKAISAEAIRKDPKRCKKGVE